MGRNARILLAATTLAAAAVAIPSPIKAAGPIYWVASCSNTILPEKGRASTPQEIVEFGGICRANGGHLTRVEPIFN